MLPPDDEAYLAGHYPGFTVQAENNLICVVLPDFSLPAGFTVDKTNLLLRLSPLYPDAVPDMWWFDPAVLRTTGIEIEQTQVVETCLGRNWQRWSRHLDPSQWRSGVDGVRAYLALIRTELARTAGHP